MRCYLQFRQWALGVLFPLMVICSFYLDVQGAPFPGDNAEQLIREAVLKVSPSLVRIETIGGLDVIEGNLAGTGATTGVIVSADGYIITSSFNFVSQPSSILVTLPDSSQRLPAEFVAVDELKQLTLLKIESQNLIPATAIAATNIRVGQWAIAVGRTYDANLPNVSLGLVSAVARMEGKAIQTDAKISPANYGGPLIDLNGEVLGILAPLSPGGKGETEGMNWYDSGIGFAIPLTEIYEHLDVLKSGQNLTPGLMGVSFLGTPAFMTEPIVQEVRPNSPADQAGLKKQDRILTVNGKPTPSVAALRQVVGNRYSGESIVLRVQRGESEQETQLQLAEKLEPFQLGWLGLLAETDPEHGAAPVIRYLFENSPAATGGLQKRDILLQLNGEPVSGINELRQRLHLMPVGATWKLLVQRDGKTQELSGELVSYPHTVPVEIPLPLLSIEKENRQELKTGVLTQKLEDQERNYDVYVPDDYQPGVDFGCLIWMSATGGALPAEQLAEWKRLCRTRGYFLLIPKSFNLQPWSGEDTSYLLACLDDIKSRYQVDSQRVCLIATGANSSYCWQLAFQNRDQIQGFIAFSLPLRFETPFVIPGQKFQMLLACQTEQELKLQPKAKQMLEKEAYPVITRTWGEKLEPAAWEELGCWLELVGSL